MTTSDVKTSFFLWKKVYFGAEDPSEEWQLELWGGTLGSYTMREFPVEASYQERFCKAVIAHCEAHGQEVYEQFYSHLTQLLTCPSSDTLNYRTYSLAASQSKGSNDNSEIREDCEACESNNITGSSESRESRVSVSLREERAVISSGTTGLCSWPAGEALATWVGGQGQARWRGSKVIELGAGAGMAGIYTIKRWGHVLSEVVLTDCHTAVLRNLEHNVTRNLQEHFTTVEEDPLELRHSSHELTVRVEHLDWQHPTPLPINPDVVLGADIVFDTTVIPSLVTTLGLLLSPSCQAFIACTVRNEDTLNFFLERVKSAGLSVEQWPLPRPADCSTPITMIHITVTVPPP